tara:strand:- start:2465 stop:3211 length:747 start_codon:yes stop_codon:yes gene_type:complete
MDYKNIIGGVILILLLYLVYKYVFNKSFNSLIKITDARKGNDSVDLKNTISKNCAYSIWLIVNDWSSPPATVGGDYSKGMNIEQDNSSYNIITTFDTNKKPVMKVELDSKANLTISLSNEQYPIKINDFPIQAWTNLIISFQTLTLDIYIDGKLVRSVALAFTNPQNQDSKNVKVGGSTTDALVSMNDGGFQGYLSTFRFFSSNLTPKDAWNIYTKGYMSQSTSGNLGKYSLRLSILDNNNTINSIKI